MHQNLLSDQKKTVQNGVLELEKHRHVQDSFLGDLE
jgi:hypothetical protein